MALPFIIWGIGIGIAALLAVGGLILAAFSGRKVVLYGPRSSGKTEFINAVMESLGKDIKVKKEPGLVPESYDCMCIETDDGDSLFLAEIRDLPGSEDHIYAKEFFKVTHEDDSIGLYFFPGYVPNEEGGAIVRLDEHKIMLDRVQMDIGQFRACHKKKKQGDQGDQGSITRKILLVVTHCDLDPDFTGGNLDYYCDQFSKLVREDIAGVSLPLVAGSLQGKKNRAKLLKSVAKTIKNNS